MAKAALYLDECVNIEVAARMVSAGYDVTSARSAGMIQATDAEQLAYAAANDRVIFTHDMQDFTEIAQTWAVEGREHAGIVFSSVRPAATICSWLEALVESYSAEELRDCTLSLPLAG